jgi:hypothetical protein
MAVPIALTFDDWNSPAFRSLLEGINVALYALRCLLFEVGVELEKVFDAVVPIDTPVRVPDTVPPTPITRLVTLAAIEYSGTRIRAVRLVADLGAHCNLPFLPYPIEIGLQLSVLTT